MTSCGRQCGSSPRCSFWKKITLDFQETGKTVLTDEKWLAVRGGAGPSNALKYTPAGGTIRIYGDGATVVIADNGIGIREEDQARVFEKGFTGYNGRADKKSTGVGLHLCRQGDGPAESRHLPHLPARSGDAGAAGP
ncbi:MAG: ATP-binding protein [Dysosmobacter sp.]